MQCLHPLPAWRTHDGQVLLTKEPKDATTLQLPCGNCLNCRKAKTQAWTLRCQLELQDHLDAVFTTLTYDDNNKPPTLDKRHLQLFFKRLRKRRGPNRTLRYFASGEYGEQTQRPHYHAIIYGIAQSDAVCIEDTWAYGHARTTTATPASIAYTAGYCQKKIGYKRAMVEQVDPETGEVYTWQPPFIQMSRRPGIGANAKKWPESWRLYAIQQDHKIAVPRFLHEAWKAQATEQQIEELIYEKSTLTRHIPTTQQLQQLEREATAKHAIAAQGRKYS